MDFDINGIDVVGGFWEKIQKKNREVTIGAVYDRFCETGRFGALKCDYKEGDAVRPHIFWDSDVFKWLEGACRILQKHPDAELKKKVDDAVREIVAHQWEDGYIGSYFTAVEPEKRFRDRGAHELYTAGHLFEAAIAHREATGSDELFAASERFFDLIDKVFRVEHSAAFRTPGHEEIELALVKMYEYTGKEKYLTLAKYFIDMRAVGEPEPGASICNQSMIPPHETDHAEGHAVRAAYLYTGMAGVAAKTGDEKLMDACRAIYDDIVTKKMYITGGIGSTHIGEAFSAPYDLPDEDAYCETCAAIALMLFAQKMLEIEGEAKYADTVERVMYNGMLAGLALSGDAFFYENPLAVTLTAREKYKLPTGQKIHRPITQRRKVFEVSCCPPNLNRTIASIERFFFREKDGAVYVDQYGESVFDKGGARVEVSTDYPASGSVKVVCKGARKLALRIPEWCGSFTIDAPYVIEKGYAVVNAPETVCLELEMKPRVIAAAPEVYSSAHKCAVTRGPVVYCAEGVDNGGYGPYRFALDAGGNIAEESAEKFGVPTLSAEGYFTPDDARLYRAYSDADVKSKIKLIPYFANENRGETDMAVWIAVK